MDKLNEMLAEIDRYPAKEYLGHATLKQMIQDAYAAGQKSVLELAEALARGSK